MTASVSSIAKAVALTDLSGVADGRAKQLIRDFGSPEAVFEAPLNAFEEYHYIDESTYNDLQALDELIPALETRYEHCRNRNIGLIPFFDPRYPERLQSVSGPLLLYARGKMSLIHHPDSVGFTGTREASDDAVKWTKQTAYDLADEGRVVISGGATGIDTAAHEGALDANGDTIVVLGTGIDVPYPADNEELFERIVDSGGLLLSQRPPDAEPSRSGFLNRNQTLTGLSHTVSVVATDGTGGTMSTYDDATDQGRIVVCPDPDLELTPTAGIEDILEDDHTTAVHNAADIIARQHAAIRDSASERQTAESQENKQVRFDDFD